MSGANPSPDTGSKPLLGTDHFFSRSRVLWALGWLWIVLRTGDLLRVTWAFDTDDAFITMRYARNLVEGHGIVWNIGETPPVEGYSNFLFVLLSALCLKLGIEPLLVIKVVSAAALLGTCVCLFLLARRWLGELGALLPVVALTAYPGTIWWTVSGLETAVFQCFAVAAVTCAVAAMDGGEEHREDVLTWARAPLVGTGLFALLASLTRPEGPLVVVAVVGGFLWRAMKARNLRALATPAAVLLCTFALPYAAYFAWRAAHFERLLPNSVLCKAAWDGNPAALLIGFLRMAGAWMLLSLAIPRRTLDARHVVIVGLSLLYMIALYGADPIIAYLGRHFLAAYALVLVPGCVGAVALIGRMWPKFGTSRREVVALAIGLVASTLVTMSYRARIAREADGYAARNQYRDELGRWIEQDVGPKTWVLAGDTGLIAYRTHAPVLDAFCLNSREWTTPPVDRAQSRFIELAYTRQPDVVLVSGRRMDRLVPTEDYGFWAAFIAHPRFATDYRLERVVGSTTADFTGGNYTYWVYRRRAIAE